MEIIKIDSVSELYPENAEQIFKEAFDNYLSTGWYINFYYQVQFKNEFIGMGKNRVYDKRWTNLGHVLRIISYLAGKEKLGFKRLKKDNHKIIIFSSRLVGKDLPCTQCKHLDGKIISLQDLVCDQPLSKLDCCNYQGVCRGGYDLLDKNGNIIREDFFVKGRNQIFGV